MIVQYRLLYTQRKKSWGKDPLQTPDILDCSLKTGGSTSDVLVVVFKFGFHFLSKKVKTKYTTVRFRRF